MILSYARFVRAHPRWVLFGFLAAFGSSFGQTFFIALFGGEIRATFGLTHGEWGTLYLLGTLGSALLLPYTGALIDRFDLSRYVTAVVLLLSVACLSMALAPHWALLVGVVFLLRHAGQGLMSHIATTVMARRFSLDRGKAVSLASLGFPVGEGLWPVVAVAIGFALGWQWAWVGFAGFAALILLPTLLFLLREPPRRNGAPSSQGEHHEDRRHWTRKEVLRDPKFWILLPGVLTPAFVVTGLFFHQVFIVEYRGWSLDVFARSYLIYAVASVLCSLSVGGLIDRYSARGLLPFFLLPLMASLVALAIVEAQWGAFVYMAFAGANAGSVYAILGALWAELYGTRHLGGVRSITIAFAVFSTSLAPAVLGWTIDLGASPAGLAWGCFIWTAFATVMVTLASRRPHMV
ncbi:MAG: MFS transporter [Alphaproteobacteria bacterium]|nr:MFS transporter [Alphaproteobacteria bacterium]